jgi:hypothetical protein
VREAQGTARQGGATEQAVSLPLTLRHGMEAQRAETARLAPFTTARLDAIVKKATAGTEDFSFSVQHNTGATAANIRNTHTSGHTDYNFLLLF